MSFLYPLFLAGAAAVGIPILLHMVRQRTRKHVTFSSLMFVPAAAPRFKNRNRIEHLPLLLLRCAIIGLLAFAFSRPFFSRPLSDNSTKSAERIVVLIDTSGSMRREGLWERAMAEAKSEVQEAGRGDSVCIMSFAQETRILMGFEEWSQLEASQRVSLATEQINGLMPGWGHTNLGDALVAAAEAIEDDEINDTSVTAAVRRIVLISDLQEGSEIKALSAYEWPGGMGLSVRAISPESTANATLQLIGDGSRPSAGDANDPPRIRVTNSSDSDTEQFQINWAADAPNEPVNVYVAPGRSSVARAPARKEVLPGRKLILTGDAHDFDNTLYIAPSLRQPINILYIGDDDPNDSREMHFYLRRAFGSSGAPAPKVVSHPGDKSIGKAAIETADLIIAGDSISTGNVAALREGIESGRTVLLAMKSVGDAETVAALARIESVEVEEAEVERYAMLGHIEFTHPLLAPFSEPRFGDFTQIHFWKYRRIDASAIPGSRVPARFDTDDPALLELPIGKGTLLVLTSSWRREDSQLALSSKFVPLLYSMLEYGGVRTKRQLQYFVGDSVPVIRSAAEKSADIRIRKPEGSTVSLGPTDENFSQTDQPGIYTIESAGESRIFAVNISPKESRTAPMPVEDIEKLGVVLDRGENVPTQRTQEMRRQANLAEMEYEQKLWRRLLAVLLLVVLAESALAGWLTRPTASINGEQP